MCRQVLAQFETRFREQKPGFGSRIGRRGPLLKRLKGGGSRAKGSTHKQVVVRPGPGACDGAARSDVTYQAHVHEHGLWAGRGISADQTDLHPVSQSQQSLYDVFGQRLR
ncbi:hypothetical protein Cabther_A1733 [Chloracidobacterium thermophilum B]|uniref:Uncharacterized protein n=1 Tax=Chloracidobacterium thermophilum (strain B) TaxID=981222 RepID=G2LDL9_CHLTF|nr:hypothetical protein Cabther_A1733 [Chloracidobacterium thermophilum B]